MSGPFSESELRHEFGQQHLISSPLGAVDKAGEPVKIRIIRDLSHKGKAPHSVNDEVDTDKETTKWGKASDMAEIVSYSTSSPVYDRAAIFLPLHTLTSPILLLFALATFVLCCFILSLPPSGLS
jgi:hypothetical protein